MHKFTLVDSWGNKELDIILDSHTKESFEQTVKSFFGEVEFSSLSVKRELNVPSIFYTPEVAETIVSDSFWLWKNLDDYDQKLLAYYMQITQDNTKTIEEAKMFKDKKHTFLRKK